jgi:cell wall-associated NlpC family hydrolase
MHGYPYVWGGESVAEGGFDCSGAVYVVQKRIGSPIPRSTSRKYALLAGGPDKHWSRADCGYWIWWTLSPDRPLGHIGMHVTQPHIWQSGSSTGPTRKRLFIGSYWDEHFEMSKAPRQ